MREYEPRIEEDEERTLPLPVQSSPKFVTEIEASLATSAKGYPEQDSTMVVGAMERQSAPAASSESLALS